MPAAIVDTDVAPYIFKGGTRGALYEPHLAGVWLIRRGLPSHTGKGHQENRDF